MPSRAPAAFRPRTFQFPRPHRVRVPPRANLDHRGDADRRLTIGWIRSREVSLSASAGGALSGYHSPTPPQQASRLSLAHAPRGQASADCPSPPRPPPCSSETAPSSANRPRCRAAARIGDGCRCPLRTAFLEIQVPESRPRTGVQAVPPGRHRRAETEKGPQ